MKNGEYWAYNLPLTAYPIHEDEDDDKSPVIGARVLNYMPRRGGVQEMDLEELIGDQTHEEFFETAALHLENLARLMREVAKDKTASVYYPDKGMVKA